MDDFAMMREVLVRRLRQGLEEEDLPDLIVVDGGKGQLNVALAVLEDLGVNGVDVVGLAKARVLPGMGDASDAVMRSSERVFVPKVRDPIILRPHTDELYLMTRLRDEAHRFAITYHRGKRGKAQFKSILSDIPGVGVGRQRALLRHFGSLKRLRNADLSEISEVKGVSERLAHAIYRALHSEGPTL